MKNKKGITFIEAIINIYIYFLIISVSVMVAVTFIKTRAVIKQKQQAVEEISMLMNEMGKLIRMSSCLDTGCGNNKRELSIEHNDGSEIHYKLTGANLERDDVIMFDKIDGEFYTIKDGENEIPLITINLWKLDKNDRIINGTIVKTSVSMRSGYEVPTSP